MNREEYLSRVSGCWLGKNIGGTLGMPMEWYRQRNNVTYYTHDITGDPLPNDDLDIQILWLLAMEEHGVDIDAKKLGEFFNEYMIFTHAEYGTAKTNLRAGLQPPVTGTFNNKFKDSCGSYIRADIWACLYPGYPALAAKYAFEDAIVDHGDGEGVYAEVFVAAMESAAFYEKDVRELIRIGLTYIPEDCTVAKVIREAVRTFDEGIDFEKSRELIMQKYIGHIEWHPIADEDERKGYGEGPMGWDVPSNIMIIIYSLLMHSNVEDCMCTAVNYGEDTDCTAGTIAALYGIMHGKEIFTEKWTKPIGNKLVTVSINPFLMYGKIPATVEELTERVAKLHQQAFALHGLEDWNGQSLEAPSWFQNIYDEMHVVRYCFPYLNVRLDYMGDPVIRPGESKRIRFILSNTSKAITSDRVRVYLYARSGVEVSPAAEQAVFLSMNHMGDGIREICYDLSVEGDVQPSYRFVAEFVYEDNHNNKVMTVPFVLLGESGATLPPKWEKRGSGGTPNLPHI